MMVFGVIRCYVLGGKLGLEGGKPDFRAGGPESWDFNRYNLNSSGDIANEPNHWGCSCLESDDSVCNSVDVCRIHIGKSRRIGQLQPRLVEVAIFRNSFCRREGLEESVLNVGVTNVAALKGATKQNLSRQKLIAY